jgi:multidrug efflux pump subunit AcrB
MGLAFMLIFVTMVLQFGSFRQAVIALLVIPFAISGVFIVFALAGVPLSFPALIGVLALFGIVVTHSMMLMDKINQNRKAGMPFDESIADAGATRLEPILLTSLLTIIGLVPISLSDPFWRGLGGSIIAGLLLTGTIKLFFIPIVYTMWMGQGEKKC